MIDILQIASLFLALAGIMYAIQILRFWHGVGKLRSGNSTWQPMVSIVIAARNEEASIEQCLRTILQQDYPTEKIEIIVVDDQSGDRTLEITNALAIQHPIIRTLHVAEVPQGVSPKKNALALGIEQSRGEIIVTTDADVLVPSGWISGLVPHFSKDTGVVTGITLFSGDRDRLLHQFQTLDFLSQTACAAGAIANGRVNNCIGSNFAFRRRAYDDIGGYSSIAHVTSGDDSLLAQQITTRTDWKAGFTYEPATHVATRPVDSWRTLIHQRMRWASQTMHYHPFTIIFLVASFVLYCLLALLIIPSVAMILTLPIPVFVFLGKMVVDYSLIHRFAQLSGTRKTVRSFFVSECLHIPIILIAVFGGYFGTFQWKDRQLSGDVRRNTDVDRSK